MLKLRELLKKAIQCNYLAQSQVNTSLKRGTEIQT
jgi:hypothetical protein